MNAEQIVTISYHDRHGEYSLSPAGVKEALEAITGQVDPGAWAHAVGEAQDGGEPITLTALAASIIEANRALLTAQARRGIRQVKCDCGHTCRSDLVMSASLGSCCPDCYDRMSD